VALVVATCIPAGVVAAVAAAAGPEYINLPQVSGNARVGERLVCSSGTWKGAGLEFKYEWVREAIEFSSGPTYTLTKADENKEVWCIVTASFNGASNSAESENSICVGKCGGEPPIAPEPREPYPAVSGTPEVGKPLTCSQGTWIGRPPPTFSYQWLRDKEAIKGATESKYTVAPADETHALSCRVTATNQAGEAKAESTNSLKVAGHAPENTSKPEVAGVAAVGETLTCKEGTWNGSAPLTFEFTWLRNGKAIAKFSTHIVEPADEGQSLSCTVIASNNLGKAEASSAAVVVNGKLKNTEAPSISGTPKEGNTLTCAGATWNQEGLTLKYHWLRESEGISESKEYKVVSADRGHLLYCQVSARNSKGEEVTSTSQPVGVANGEEVPKNTGSPEVEGTPTFPNTLTCSEGSWTNSPEPGRYVFQWLREKKAIVNATAKTHKVEVADQGHKLSCKVIAQNGEGASVPAESGERYVSGEAPSVTKAPEAVAESPTPRVGEALTCLRGEWKGEPSPTFTYAWLRDGTTNVGASAAYTIVSADRGHSLSCTVTAINDEAPGGVSADSNGVYIPGSPPEPPVGGPAISGEPAVGLPLTCSPGAWTGAPAPTFKFQWLLNNSPIPSAINPTFTVGSADRGFMLSCRVTGTNSEAPGGVSATSKGIHVLGMPPKAEELPFVSGTGAVGLTLTCQRGIWSGKPPPSFTYQWFRDAAPIASATESTYTAEPADQGHLVTCNVTAANSEGRVEVESLNGVAIASRPPGTIVPPPGPGNGGTVKTVQPNPGVILASINRQLSVALSGAHIKKIMKSGSFWFSFIAPWAGKLEVLWYNFTKGAHGSKTKQLVLAQSTTSFTGIKKGTIRLKLTIKGRQVLKNKRRMTVKAKAIFTIPHQKPVVWAVTLVLTQ